MKYDYLKPRVLVSTLSESINEGLLTAHMDLLNRGGGTYLPPSIVTPVSFAPPGLRMPARTEYILLEGNHKAVARTLIRYEVPVIIAEKDSDLKIIRTEAEEGKLHPFSHTQDTIAAILETLQSGTTCLEVDLEAYIKHMIKTQELDIGKLPPYLVLIASRNGFR